ncbi:MAG: rhodanese-like domain-containing protein [Saprospiraceae bacterium]|nr:rhodanese-like domain-containing protein [Saprospiraceae bacterium]
MLKKIFGLLFGSQEPVDLKQYINDGAYLVDVRTASEFASGHVTGSTNIPLQELNQNLSKLKNKKHIIVFCRSGNRSKMAKGLLKSKGFNNIIDGRTWTNVNKFV